MMQVWTKQIATLSSEGLADSSWVRFFCSDLDKPRFRSVIIQHMFGKQWGITGSDDKLFGHSVYGFGHFSFGALIRVEVTDLSALLKL
jgi:hypothetical protein